MRLGIEFLGPLMFRRNRRVRARRRPIPPHRPSAAPVPFVWTLPEALRARRGSAPNIGVILDAVALAPLGRDRRRHPRRQAQRIVHVHVSDAKPTPAEDVLDNMRHFPGEG